MKILGHVYRDLRRAFAAVGRWNAIHFFAAAVVGINGVCAAESHDAARIEEKFKREVRPLLKEYCISCHSTEKQKGDLDLERFVDLKTAAKEGNIWENVIEQLSLGEMPPKDKPQPTDLERKKLANWSNSLLNHAAEAQAGDPGPVVLRRLNNAEYTFTLRDLTGIESLDPAREFPVDGAAGEGFMNTGNALVMSPSLFDKYLDAAKKIAGHAVLVPDGFRFSAKTTRHDWAEEILREIRQLYARYTDPEGGDKINLQGIIFETNEGGRLPLERYFRATLSEREGLSSGRKTFEDIAQKNGLSSKYLRSLWSVLTGKEPSLLFDGIRSRWANAKPEEAASLTLEVARWQRALWKFSSVGHIGKAGGPKEWMEPISPLVDKHELRLKLTPPTNANEVVVYLVASSAGSEEENDIVVWQEPRLVVPGRVDIPLRDARGIIEELTARREQVMSSIVPVLAAAGEVLRTTAEVDAATLARRNNVDPEVLTAWLEYLGLNSSGDFKLDYFTDKIEKLAGYDFVKGWGSENTPSLVANSSDQHIRIPGNMRPHGVAVHPTPQLNVAAGWKSPLATILQVKGRVTHAHPECGNGVEWFLELRRGKVRQRLAQGTAQGGKDVIVGPIENLNVRVGDLVSLIIGPRDGNHSCDLTDIELVLKGRGDEREWSLARDISNDVLAGNPHSDRFGNAGVWHFYTEPVSNGQNAPNIPAGSLLARWQNAEILEEQGALAREIQKLLLGEPPAAKESLDAKLYAQLRSLSGPLLAAIPSSNSHREPKTSGSNWALDPQMFGRLPGGKEIEAKSLSVRAPSVIEVRLPADFATGTELVASGILHPEAGAEGSVQLQLTTTRPAPSMGMVAGEIRMVNKGGQWTSETREASHSTPILVNESSAARRRIEAGFDEFRNWFPAALCYTKIVPVDEVVTLTLAHREDDHLARLMLDTAEQSRLNRLWDEYQYVSQNALLQVDAFEQLWQYATQDADPKVFEPMRKPIAERASAFRERLVETEPKRVEALIEFASKAYRHPINSEERNQLSGLYGKLREQEIPHEEAFRLVLSRVFVAPAFLYRLEQAGPGKESVPVSQWELATRLSYFLWASLPDDELRAVAASGRLQDPNVLAAQARRMLSDPRIKRLATEFACAWLHIYDFETLDEKSERHFPTFAELRSPMHQEAVLFFTDLFRGDGSVLNVFDADYTFVNESLANHYGIPGVSGNEWRRVDGAKKYSRGGVLTMAATLAKQSGASRTSPILRGNWVSEVLLGEKLPRPPKGVPPLPEDEATETLTVRQLVEKHTSDPSCANCHARIDGYGFAMEGFDAVGRARNMDLAGHPIDTRAKLFGGAEVDGVDGLRDFLLNQRRDALLQQFCRKLLGYALGRGVILSDRPLLAEMQRALREKEYAFSAAVEAVVTSKQFREVRGKEQPSED